MNTNLFNLITVVISTLTVLVIAVSAFIAIMQLKSFKKTRDVELMAKFYEKLISKEFGQKRKYVYTRIPCPLKQIEQHRQWLEEIIKPSNYENYESILQLLYEFDRIALLIRKSQVDVEIALDLWFDVIARICVQLQYFISREVRERGDGYMINFYWLARKNIVYITKLRTERRIFLKTDEGRMEITRDDVDTAIRRFGITPI